MNTPDSFDEMRAVLRSGRHIVRSGRDLAAGRSSVWRSAPLDRDRVLEQLRDRVASVESLAEELHALVTTHNPMSVLAAVSIRTQTTLVRDGSDTDFTPELFSWDAMMEYIQGLALSDEPGTTEPDEETIDRIMNLVEDLFDAEQARIVASAIEKGTHRSLGSAAMLLRIEHLVDRMQGYATHLETIHRAVFGPIRDECVDAFGFCPSDVAPIVRVFLRSINDELNAGRDVILQLYNTYGELPDPDSLEPGPRHAIELHFRRLFHFHEWEVADVAAHVPIDEAMIESVLTAMSAEWGCQPDFRRPHDPNRARTHPVVRLDVGRFWVPRPWDLLHGLLTWWDHELRARSLDALKVRYERSRDLALQQITADTLRGVFGESQVYESQHFSDGRGSGEVDVLVAVSDYPLVVECKAGSLTASGRRGAPDRVGRVVDDIISRSFTQLARATTYILDGGRRFAPRQGRPAVMLLPAQVLDVPRIAVTYEQMDPLTADATLLAERDTDEAVWFVSIADFMMVADVLTHPATFLAYAKARAELAPTRVHTYVESDVLGLYLKDRWQGVMSLIASDVDRVNLGYSSTLINEYFTSAETGTPGPPPSVGVPPSILDALGESTLTIGWGRTATAAMALHVHDWAKWAKYVRRRLTRSRGPIRFKFTTRNLEIVVSQEEHPRLTASPEIAILYLKPQDLDRASLRRDTQAPDGPT